MRGVHSYSLLALILLAAGCQSTERSPGIIETVDADGVPVRLEMEADDEPELSPDALAERLVAYRASKLRDDSGTRSPTEGPGLRAAATAAEASAFDPYLERGCPPEGSAHTDAHARLNRLKNRMGRPLPSDIDPSVTLEALRESGDDRNRWFSGLGATVEGFVKKAKSTGKESCNCKKSKRALTDIHMDITAGPDDPLNPLIAEITPVMRLVWKNEGQEITDPKDLIERYRGKWVRITGWMFYDKFHESGADTTDPGDQRGESPNWRATAWEIHPITSIELIDPPE